MSLTVLSVMNLLRKRYEFNNAERFIACEAIITCQKAIIVGNSVAPYHPCSVLFIISSCKERESVVKSAL